jgi:GT2 family glycosyltransferase
MAASWWLIVLSWNGREDTLACLRSLRGLQGADTRVVVVDNGSTDGSVEAVREQHPEVDVVENGRNLGFSGGNNAGIRHALEHGAAWVVLVNNDAILAPDAVERLRAAATARPRAGMLAGKLFFDEPPARIWFAGQRFSAALGYSGRPYGYGRSDAPRYRRPGPTGRCVPARPASRCGSFRTRSPGTGCRARRAASAHRPTPSTTACATRSPSASVTCRSVSRSSSCGAGSSWPSSSSRRWCCRRAAARS